MTAFDVWMDCLSWFNSDPKRGEHLEFECGTKHQIHAIKEFADRSHWDCKIKVSGFMLKVTYYGRKVLQAA